MSYTTFLSLGYPQTITQNIIYALPTSAVTLQTEKACEVSTTTGFTTKESVAADTPTKVAGGYIRCTGSDAVVFVKRD